MADEFAGGRFTDSAGTADWRDLLIGNQSSSSSSSFFYYYFGLFFEMVIWYGVRIGGVGFRTYQKQRRGLGLVL